MSKKNAKYAAPEVAAEAVAAEGTVEVVEGTEPAEKPKRAKPEPKTTGEPLCVIREADGKEFRYTYHRHLKRAAAGMTKIDGVETPFWLTNNSARKDPAGISKYVWFAVSASAVGYIDHPPGTEPDLAATYRTEPMGDRVLAGGRRGKKFAAKAAKAAADVVEGATAE
jgi:hypothetical protein